ncbi:cryptochrome/photolyase family protein [Oricola thermophila]|uniref:Deoxyribodipyrimidine photo-lyase n=1 Tax=Oricola thermophila TaxID=2742145 RepID=A0A6N1VB16_9HYPH|nr:deoxyribodipyrimidine photo-lyase [Oricola thermophila]QKV17733.1 deoxyribodipyrimidine photo-lyase [Oricola thermophila]
MPMNATSPAENTVAPAIVWFRNDLRVDDNRALLHAAESGCPVIPLFVLEDAHDTLPLGGAQRWWLHQSLLSLSAKLDTLGAALVLRRGDPEEVLDEIIRSSGADRVFWNRRYLPGLIERDTAIKSSLRDRAMTVESFHGQLLHEPTQLRTGSGGPYRVYTPFWRAFCERPPPRPPSDAPRALVPFHGSLVSDQLADWTLLPAGPDWSTGLSEEWEPGEEGAKTRLERFLAEGLGSYGSMRDRPGVPGTSRLSPHIAFGEISPFRIWQEVENVRNEVSHPDLTVFRKELLWREFSYHLLVNFPSLGNDNFNSDFDAFPWLGAGDRLARWQRGETGYPIVDAGMRELWQTGWMHNRVRMIVGSFLVKHLLIDWRLGEAWFRDTLVDADPASNAASWQWIAGSGADAAPYFRIFSPILQGRKFDPDGAYVRRFVPELAAIPDKFLHTPWTAPEPVLAEAGIELGRSYPLPIVEHGAARKRALAAYKTMKEIAAAQ